MNYSLKHLLLAGIAMLAGSLAYAQVTTSSWVVVSPMKKENRQSEQL